MKRIGVAALLLLTLAAGTQSAPVGQSGSRLTVVPGAAYFPLAVSSNGRYLVDHFGNPFRLQTDAGWLVVSHGSDDDGTTYLNQLKARGFKSTILMNIVHAGGSSWPNLYEPADFYHNQPFTNANQLDTPNPVYFARVSAYIDQAMARGIAVQFFHTYAGYNGGADGWESVFTDAHNTNTVCFNWGVYLATTFTQPNIIWMNGGDHTLSGTALSRFQQIVAGIQSATRNRLAGSEWDSPDTLVTVQSGFTYGVNPATSDMQLDSFYGQGPLQNSQSFTTADLAWANSPTLPASLEEPTYENAWYDPTHAARQQLRATYNWAIMAGATAGGTVGVDNRWNWVNANDPLSTFASSPASLDAQRVYVLYQSLKWWLMRPSGTASGYAGRVLVVSGAGSGTSTVPSSLASDGTQMIAYVPPTGAGTTSISMDLRSMAASSRARWWNPTDGTYTNIAGGGYTFANTLSSQSFTTPGDNGTGYNDWILVIDTP